MAIGYLTHIEQHTSARLYLPMGYLKDDELLEDLITKMDVDDQGRVGLPEFIHFITETGSPICSFALV